MSDWLAFNDPFFTDKEPYCNTVRFITKADAIAYYRRLHPDLDSEVSDARALDEFIMVNWAWWVPIPDLRVPVPDDS